VNEKSTPSRRVVLAGAALVGPFAALVGCGGQDPEAGGGDQGTPVDGGTLTYAVGTQPAAGGVDPMVATALAAQSVMNLAYETLLVRDDDGQIQPCLATEHEQVDDLTWRFTLREGVKFADGSPFTADDVVYTFQTYLQATTSKKAYLGGLDQIVAVDPQTVEFVFDAPNGTFLNAVAHRETFMIVGAAGYGAASEDDRQRLTYGTGAFQLTDWQDGVSLTFTANENYWGEGVPHLAGIQMPIITDESTRLATLQQGSAQAVAFTDGTVADQAAKSGFELGELNFTQSLPIFVNPESGPLADVRVRQALSLALDRQALIDVAMLGYGKLSLVTPAGDPAAPQPDGDTPNYTRDVAEAKALLAEAGQPNPTVVLSYFGDVSQAQHPIYELMQQQCAEAGITLDLQATPTSELAPIFTAGESFTDLVSLPWSYRADPTFYFDPFLSEAGAMNHWRENPDADTARDLLAQAKATVDEAVKADLVQQLVDEVAQQVLILVPMAVPQNYEVWDSAKFFGYTTDPYGSRSRLPQSWVQS